MIQELVFDRQLIQFLAELREELIGFFRREF